MCIPIGMKVKTNYDTGPYIIEKVSGPCKCQKFVDMINNIDSVSEEHYHFTCREADNPKSIEYGLGGYAEKDGRILSVWQDNEIFILGMPEPKIEIMKPGTQFEMF